MSNLCDKLSHKAGISTTIFDVNFFSRSKIIKLTKRYPGTGIAVYLAIVFEIAIDGRPFSLNDCEIIETKTGVSEVDEIIKALIELGLLINEGEVVYSERILEEISRMQKKKKQWKDSKDRLRGATSVLQDTNETPTSVLRDTNECPTSGHGMEWNGKGMEWKRIGKEEEQGQGFRPLSEIVNKSLADAINSRIVTQTRVKQESAATSQPDPLKAIPGYEFIETVRASLASPNEQITRDNRHIIGGKLPMIKYPDIWLTEAGLCTILDAFTKAGLQPHDFSTAFKKVNAKLEQQKIEGKRIQNAAVENWLLGWALSETVEQKKKSTDLKRSEKYLDEAQK